MAVYLIENYSSDTQVRGLLYEDADELTGTRIETANAGVVECLPGSVAMKAGFKDICQLDADGVWQSA